MAADSGVLGIVSLSAAKREYHIAVCLLKSVTMERLNARLAWGLRELVYRYGVLWTLWGPCFVHLTGYVFINVL